MNSGLCLVEMPSLRKTLPSSNTRSKPPTLEQEHNSPSQRWRRSRNPNREALAGRGFVSLKLRADDEALQVQLGRDAQREGPGEGVVVRHEGAGLGSASLRLTGGRGGGGSAAGGYSFSRAAASLPAPHASMRKTARIVKAEGKSCEGNPREISQPRACRTGVSISRKLLSSRDRRIVEMMRERERNTSRTCGYTDTDRDTDTAAVRAGGRVGQGAGWAAWVVFGVAARLGAGEHVDVALPVAHLDVLEAVELVREGKEGLGEELDVLDDDGELALLRALDGARRPDDVADVEGRLHHLEGVVAHAGLVAVQLDRAGVVLHWPEGDYGISAPKLACIPCWFGNVYVPPAARRCSGARLERQKGELAEDPAGHHTAGHSLLPRQLFACWQVRVLELQLAGHVRSVETVVEGVLARLPHLLDLLQAEHSNVLGRGCGLRRRRLLLLPALLALLLGLSLPSLVRGIARLRGSHAGATCRAKCPVPRAKQAARRHSREASESRDPHRGVCANYE